MIYNYLKSGIQRKIEDIKSINKLAIHSFESKMQKLLIKKRINLLIFVVKQLSKHPQNLFMQVNPAVSKIIHKHICIDLFYFLVLLSRVLDKADQISDNLIQLKMFRVKQF